jgi:hypothetical protein
MSPIYFRSPSLLAHSDGVIEQDLVAVHESEIGPEPKCVLAPTKTGIKGSAD